MKIIEKIEKVVEKNIEKTFAWLAANANRVVLFVFISMFVFLASLLPYVNLYFTNKVIVYFLLIVLFVIFRVSWKKILLFSFLLFFMGLSLVLLENYKYPSLIGNYIYGILVYAFIDYVRKI